MIDVFAIQDEIGQAISEALQVRLAPRTKAVNVEAYQLYLKGQYHRSRLTAESLAKARECFEQSLAIDPNYASAYSGLAEYYVSLAGILAKPTGEVAPSAKAAAQKALALDPANSEAHSALATMAGIFDYDWKLAETHFRKAVATAPVSPLVRYRYAQYYLQPLGRFADAIEQFRLALEADPVSVVLHMGMAVAMNDARRYREAMEYSRRGLEIDPNFPYYWWGLGMAQLHEGLAKEAIASFQRVADLMPWWGGREWQLATACHQAGDHARSEELARTLAKSYGQGYWAAIYYAAIGEADAMFDALEGAYQQRDRLLISIKNERFFDPYRADPRFQSLLAKMNLA
jgi:Tfp pilus assembly protein PilF